jgi:hypothetical protein
VLTLWGGGGGLGARPEGVPRVEEPQEKELCAGPLPLSVISTDQVEVAQFFREVFEWEPRDRSPPTNKQTNVTRHPTQPDRPTQPYVQRDPTSDATRRPTRPDGPKQPNVQRDPTSDATRRTDGTRRTDATGRRPVVDSTSVATFGEFGEFHYQGDAKWIVIRGQLKGHNNTPFGWPTADRPIGCPGVGRPQGVYGGLSYY